MCTTFHLVSNASYIAWLLHAAGGCNDVTGVLHRHGKKLDYARITALLYTVGLVFDKTSLSQTSVPSGTR